MRDREDSYEKRMKAETAIQPICSDATRPNKGLATKRSLQNFLITTAVAVASIGFLTPTTFAGFKGGPAGFEVEDFAVGAHAPLRGSNLVEQ